MPAPVPISQAKPIGNDPEFIATLDRFGFLDVSYRQAKHWLDERESLKKVIQTHYAAHPADKPVHVEGALYAVDLSVREKQRKLTSKAKAFAALKKALGLAALQDALTYTLKLIDQHIPADKQKAFVIEERTGPREISAAVKSAPAA